MNKRLCRSFSFAIFIVLFFSSCQNFFTTSLAEIFARDSSDLVPKVTSGNAAEVADSVKSDPDASLVVLGDLSDLISNEGTSDTKKNELAVLALDVSANASGVSGAFLESTGPIADLLLDGDFDDSETQEELFTIIDDALAGLDNVSDSASTLEGILTTPGVTVDSIKETASADEMAMAAIVLLSNNATAAGSDGVSGYVDQLGDKETSEMSSSELLAMDLAEAASAKYAAEGGTGPLADVLAALNLTGA